VKNWGLRAETLFFAFLCVFIAGTAITYWYLAHDWTGTVALVFLSLLGLLIAFYLGVTGRRTGERAQDRDADISEGAGVVGHFSPASPWAPAMAASVGLGVLGFIFGLWLAVIGVILLFITTGGLLFEHVVGKRSVADDLMH
jgi:hypothetical protein